MAKLTDYLLQNPMYDQGQRTSKEGSSVAPVYSTMQGLARALQGGIGGALQGYALGKAREDQAGDAKALGEAMKLYGTDPDAATAMLASRPMLSDTAQAMMVQQMGYQQSARLGKLAADQGDAQFGGARASPTPGGYNGTVATGESGNDPQIVNPKSGAAGTYQFMPGTWAATRSAHPELNLPETVAQATPEHQTAAMNAFTQDNARELHKAGLPLTPANLYLAHRAGAKGAQTILSAPPDAPLSTVVPPEWIAANPDMKTTAGDFVAKANQKFGGSALPHPDGAPSTGAVAPDPALWARLRPMVMLGEKNGGMTMAKAQEIMQADLQSRRQQGVTEAGLNQREQFQATQRVGEKTIAAKNALENEETFKEAARQTPIMQSIASYQKDPTKAGALGLVQSVAQIMEPGSVSKDGQIELRSVGPLAERLKAYIAQVGKGSGLTPEQRQELVSMATQRYSAMAGEAHKRGMAFRDMAPAAGVNPDHVYDPKTFASAGAPEGVPQGAPGTQPQIITAGVGGRQPVPVKTPEEAAKLPKGTPILLPDGTHGVVP